MRCIDLFEAPIDNWQVDSDFDQNERIMKAAHKAEYPNRSDVDTFHHWSDSDKRAINDPDTIERIKSAFLKVPYRFNIYFWQSTKSNYDKFLQKGAVHDDWIREVMGEKVLAEIQSLYSPDAITIIMTNNLSDDHKVNMRSSWIMAHRISHSLLYARNGNPGGWDVLHKFEKFIKDITSYAYGVKWPKNLDTHFGYVQHQEMLSIYGFIIGKVFGTMNSARKGKLVNDAEWIHETFSQYLMTGSVTLNPLPSEIHPEEILTVDPVKLEKAQKVWSKFPSAIEKAFDKMLKDAKGGVFVI